MAALPVLFTTLPTPAVAQSVARAKPGDILVFRISGGGAEVARFAAELPEIEGVTCVVVNEKVTAADILDTLQKTG